MEMITVLDRDATYAAIRTDKVGFEEPVDVVRVSGPDALSYLQGQVSQDLSGLSPGGAVETLVLSPQGKLDGFAWLVQVADDEAILVSPLGFGEALYDRLRRFKIRVKADLSLEAWERARAPRPEGRDRRRRPGRRRDHRRLPGLSGRRPRRHRDRACPTTCRSAPTRVSKRRASKRESPAWARS